MYHTLWNSPNGLWRWCWIYRHAVYFSESEIEKHLFSEENDSLLLHKFIFDETIFCRSRDFAGLPDCGNMEKLVKTYLLLQFCSVFFKCHGIILLVSNEPLPLSLKKYFSKKLWTALWTVLNEFCKSRDVNNPKFVFKKVHFSSQMQFFHYKATFFIWERLDFLLKCSFCLYKE